MNRKTYASNALLSLVEYRQSDDSALYNNWQDQDTQKGFNGAHAATIEDSRRLAANQRFFAMIRLNSTGDIAGAVGISLPEREADLAIWLFKGYRRQGIGTQAFALAAKYAVEALGITELHAGAYPDNIGSQKMLKRCGFVPNSKGNYPAKHYLTGDDVIELDHIYKPQTQMEYAIKHVTTEREFQDALAFAVSIFGERVKTHTDWRKHMERNEDLLLFAESGGEIVGIVFGRIENDCSLTVGIVAVNERFRNLGLAREMMKLLEERAIKYGVYLITLGAVQTAEGFYAKLGYTGSLLIQSEKHGINELLALNAEYKVRYTNIYDGKVNQVCLKLPEADRLLQSKYEIELPGCHTQMMFWKNI